MDGTRRGASAVRAGAVRLSRSFLAGRTLDVARGLLGMRLVRVLDGVRLSVRIVEVEAYIGTGDTACHASKGRTPRNAVMFGPPGHAYVYFTYGMHWMLNVVTEPEGFPAAVLIRAGEPREGIETMRRRRPGREGAELTAGPARLCQALAIDRLLNAADLVRGESLFIEEDEPVADRAVGRSPRIGIDYAAPCDRKAPWRFLVKESPYVTRWRRARR